MQFLEKTMENVGKHRYIKLVPTVRRRNYLVSERNYHTTKFFSENLLATEMRKNEILMNKPVYLGPSILKLSKALVYELWYDYVKLVKKQNCVIWIQFHCIHKNMVFIKTLQKMLKLDLMLQIMN